MSASGVPLRKAVVTGIAGVIAAGVVAYVVGGVAGERAYYAGVRDPGYEQAQGSVRGAAFGFLTPPVGAFFILGFENKFYSMP